jgi:hypothetical protein
VDRHRIGLVVVAALASWQAAAQPADFIPVTDSMLQRPAAADWLSFSRTPDAQRYSPLDQINRDNVADLKLAWSRGFGPGALESIPLVYDGAGLTARPVRPIIHTWIPLKVVVCLSEPPAFCSPAARVSW